MGFNFMKNRSITSNQVDIVDLLINSSYELKVKKFGDSFYLLVPADLAKRLKLRPGNYVRVVILGVVEPVEEEVIE